jgi:hypothetical protein
MRVSSVDEEPFNFIGAYFSTWPEDGEFHEGGVGDPPTFHSSNSVTILGIQGYLDDAPVGPPVFIPLTTEYEFSFVNLQNIDSLDIVGDQDFNSFWRMDNFVYTQPDSCPPIPEPSTMLLLSTGLGGFALVAWRRKGVAE